MAKVQAASPDPAGPADPPAAGARQLTRRDWIDAAIDTIAGGSVESLKVERLAVGVGVSRGSFYWHFENRDDLIAAVLEAWLESATLQINARLERQESDPAKRLLMFMSLPLSSRRSVEMANFELAILSWSRRAAPVRAAIAKVDALRVGHLTGLLEELGFEGGEAELRAHGAYGFLRYIAQRTDLSDKKRRRLTEGFHRQLLAQASL